MKNNLVSVLITNFNKASYIKNTLDSCFNQKYRNKEILLFDDCSSDNSIDILKKIKNKNFSLILNQKKKYQSGPLNQLFGIKSLFDKSKGKIIFLLDSDDYFFREKLNFITKKFTNDKKINFIQDIPFINKLNKRSQLKIKDHSISIWPSFFPTSCISVKRQFFMDFLKNSEINKFPNLEIDARICIFAFLRGEYKYINKVLTVYNFDSSGITSKYKKFSLNWWKKRNEAFMYMQILMKKMKIKFIPSLDYYITKTINYFL